MSWRRQALWFAVGGAVGFVVDAGILHVLMQALAWNPYAARVVSFLVAASVTWLWNRHVTFADRRRLGARAEWTRWVVVMGVGALLNYAVFALLVSWITVVQHWPVLGVAAGSLAGAAANFQGARTVVFGLPGNVR